MAVLNGGPNDQIHVLKHGFPRLPDAFQVGRGEVLLGGIRIRPSATLDHLLRKLFPFKFIPRPVF